MRYEIVNGTHDHVIFLLHGTGGDAKSLFDLGAYIDSEATLIGIEGDVFEQGMRRYFARYRDGSFDLDSLDKSTKELHQDILNVIEKYDLGSYKKTILGYSNGANIAQNMMKEFVLDIDNVVLFHPSTVRLDVPFLPQKDTRIFASYGENDPFISSSNFERVVSALKEATPDVKIVRHTFGHSLIQEELDEVVHYIMNK